MPGFAQKIRQWFLGSDEPRPAARGAAAAQRIDARSAPVPADSQEIVSMARDFRHFLDQQDQRQQELARVVGQLPQTMGALPELVRQQTRLADLVAQQLMYARQRDEQVEKTLARITQGVEQQRDVMSLVQQQLDLNHESAVQVAQGVTTLARAVEQLQGTSDRSTQALQGLLEKTSDRDAELQKQYASVQNWMLGLFIMTFGTLAAAVILIWVALESGRGGGPPTPVAPAPAVTPAESAGDAGDDGPDASPSSKPSPTTLPALGGASEPLKSEPAPATGG
jgi:hypothetical protein